MSDDSVPEEEVRIETDVLDLRKRASRSSTAYPVFEYRIEYRGSSPGELALAESLPDGLGESDVEFHPDFHGENWSCDGERVFFEIMVPEAEVVETKFGLSVDDPEAVETVLTPPLVTVDDLDTGERIASLSADDAETVVPGADDGMDPVEPDPVSDAVRDIILGDEGEETAPDPETLTADVDGEEQEAAVAGAAGDGEFVAAAPAADADGEDDAAEATGENEPPADDPDSTAGDDLVAEAVDTVVSGAETDAEPDDPVESNDDVTTAPTDADADTAATDDDTGRASGDAGEAAATSAPDPGDGGSVGAALAAELRSGEIPEEDVELLRERLNLTVAESDAVRLRDLQSRYHDLEAYTEALSAFVDEHGDADGVLADLQSDVERLDDELTALSSAEQRLDDRPDGDDLVERIDGVVADLDAAERRLDERVSEVEQRLATLETTVGELEDETEVLLELQDVFGTD